MHARATDSVACPWRRVFRAVFLAVVLADPAAVVQGANMTTIIYEGRRFEIRDHDQPTKYVFNGSTRVAEITSDPYQFTQKERDQETGLHYFETRYLAGGLGRFVTPDLKYACPDRLSREEFAVYVSTPAKLNLYSYVQNNPVRYFDPLGQDEAQPDSHSVILTLSGGGEEINMPISSWFEGLSAFDILPWPAN